MDGKIALPTYETLLTEAMRSLAVDSGILTSQTAAGTNVLTDATKNWPPDVHRHRLVKVIRGAGAGQTAIVDGNTAKSLVVRQPWPVALDTTSMYVILDVGIPRMKTTRGILIIASLGAGATSTLAACTALDLRNNSTTLALTVAATYNALATRGLRVHVRTSPDDVSYDTADWDVWDAGFAAGAAIRETQNYNVDPMYLKVLIENLDPARAITNILVTASMGTE